MTLKTVNSGAEPLTRRTFLEQFGLVGGSTLVMTAMRSWDLMAAQAGPRPVLSGRPNGTKVVVLGAGVSGLTVAYELGKLGSGTGLPPGAGALPDDRLKTCIQRGAELAGPKAALQTAGNMKTIWEEYRTGIRRPP